MSCVWFDIFRVSVFRVVLIVFLYGVGGWVYNFEVEIDYLLGVIYFVDVFFMFGWIEEDYLRLFVYLLIEINC